MSCLLEEGGTDAAIADAAAAVSQAGDLEAHFLYLGSPTYRVATHQICNACSASARSSDRSTSR